MKKIGHIICVIMLLGCVSVKAQDVHFTQFYASPLNLNPAFAGADVCFRVSATYRNQWSGVPNGYRSSLFAIDHYAHRQRLGFGLLLSNDVAGSGNLRRTSVSPIIATEVRASRSLSFRFGMHPTIGTVAVDFDKLLFGDQIARGGNINTVEDPTQNVTYFDMSAGSLMFTKYSWLGIAGFNFLSPNEGLTPDSEGHLPTRLSVHGGHKFKLGESKAMRNVSKESISTVFHYRGQQEFGQLDIGFYYTKESFNFGFWYRGLPGVKAYAPGYSNNDAVAIIIGVKTHRMNIGYSYDFTISKLTNATNGANEITLSAQLCNPKKRRQKPRSFTPCPSF